VQEQATEGKRVQAEGEISGSQENNTLRAGFQHSLLQLFTKR
jgi:hypothetical protein